VTKAQPWESYHQYGLASDLVLFVDGQWSWDTSGPRAAWWKRMQELGRANGLEALSFEMPHLQITGTSIAQLRSGAYPAGGDDSWANTLASAVYGWQGTPPAPTAPTQVAERPPLPPEALAVATPASVPAAAAISTGPLASVSASDWHARFNGQRWRADAGGVYTKGFDDGRSPMRTDGQPVTMRRIWALLGDAILAASRKHGIPPALIMMVIATETASYRNYGFTGPFTFRWEPGVKVNDVTPNLFGDYSVGPMQILATTARWVIGTQRLDYDAFKTAPVFERRPEPPQSLPLYDAAANIDIGAAVIRQRWAQSGDDPILVAASYNAGGVYSSDDNPWRIRCYGNHLDRAA
jgi:peptidoglycan L-alanyl-D-glutamate endopeptidase CwlK